jgi:hypothetical protein
MITLKTLPQATEQDWLPVVGQSGYFVSRNGEVYSNKSGIMLKLVLNKFGYLVVTRVFKSGTYLVHRIVALAFIPNPENKPEVNHINGIKTDNRVENLEWVTKKENIRHAYDVLGRKGPSQGVFGKDNSRSKAILQFSRWGKFLAEYGSIEEAERVTKVNQSNIIKCAKGKIPRAGCFMWKYKTESLALEYNLVP